MRYAKILFLNFQRVFEERGRSLVWFLLSLFSPLLMILFWEGAKISGSQIQFSAISSYYLLLVVAGSLLMSHSEENVSMIDIQEGRLGSYLLKPFLYFFMKWFEELPYRFLQGSFGIIILIVFSLFFHIFISSFVTGFFNIFFIVLIILASVVLAQIYKMCLGFISFWLTDAYGFFQLSEMLLFIFAGYIVPLSLYPSQVAVVAYSLPFAYMMYFPVAAVEGMFTSSQLLLILLGQGVWIFLGVFIYNFLWRQGVKEFTGVGQ